jgi:hypothetical protein
VNQSLKTAMRAMWVAGAWLSIWVSAACLAATGPDYGVNLEGAKAANAAVHVTQFWQDTYFGNPENPRTTGHGLSAIGDPAPIFKDGRYTSPYQGFELLIPRVGESTNVILAQALVSKRADGTPITTDIVLTMPGKSAYALVVTRMRDDRPKDTETGLSEFEPKLRTSAKRWNVTA